MNSSLLKYKHSTDPALGTMERKFKCCKKDFNNYVCISCYGIIHGGCLNKMKKVTELDGYKVYCSVKCEKVDNEKQLETHKMYEELKRLKSILVENADRSQRIENDYDKNIEILQEEVLELKNDIRMREEHYRKEKIKSRDIEDEAMEMEQRCVREMKTLIDRNRYLAESLKDVTNKMKDMDRQLLLNTEELSKQQREYMELMQINKQMINSIRLLETENETNKIVLQENLNPETSGTIPKIKILENHLLNPSVSDSNLLQLKVPETDVTVQLGCPEANFGTTTDNTLTHGTNATGVRDKPAHGMEVIRMQRKLLIIGDESVKDLTGYVKNLFNSNYVIEGFVMPNIELETLSKLLFNYIVNYDENDLIICSFKTSNISNHKSLFSFLKNILPITKFSNLILISQRSQLGDKRIEKTIYNKVLYYNKVIRNRNVNYFSNVYNLRGFINKTLISLIPRTIQNGINTIVLKSIRTDNTVENPYNQIHSKSVFFRE